MPWQKTIKCLAAALLPVLSQTSFSNIELSPLISDGAVLQRDQPVPVWGKTAPNAEVRITLGDETKKIKSTADGNWLTEFKPHPAGATMQLQVNVGEDSKTVKNIIFGDVWLCGGQSNMEWPLKDTINGPKEIKTADYPEIRQFKVPRIWSAKPKTDVVGGPWQMAKAPQVKSFSAVGYYFAQDIYTKTQVPIGLLESNWGGSSIEAWMSAEALNELGDTTVNRIKKFEQDFATQKKAVAKLLSRWPGALVKKMTAAKADWSAANLKTDDWINIEAPELWEEQQLPYVDGVVWYRKDFNLTEAQAKQPLNLLLARIDDNDVTWVNGHKVGETEDYSALRNYRVEAKYLKPGINSIAVRVEDTGGGGGIYAEKDNLALEWDNGKKTPLTGTWKLKADRVYLTGAAKMNQVPTALFNAMLNPLFKFPIKGAIWYQGESNAGSIDRATLYEEQFNTLINEWRAGWQQPEMPFYWVQLAGFNSKGDSIKGSPWATLRQSQTNTLSLPNTGQAVIIDVGDRDDIHPRNKKTVGKRLAAIALNNDYDISSHHRGPYLVAAKLLGKKIEVKFSAEIHSPKELGKRALGFTAIGKDGAMVQVGGHIKSPNKVIIDVAQLPFIPKKIAYAWQDYPGDAKLKGVHGLPAEPGMLEVTAGQ